MERVRFGIFDFAPSTGELRRSGVAVKLQTQPARVLAVLVAHPGQIVTRDTLQAEVWRDGTHVDFDRGLNFCVAQVRAALGDSADTPRYIETVPRQGYRFIAPIGTETSQLPDAVPEVSPPSAPIGFPRRAAFAAGLVLLAGAVGWFITARVASGPPTIAVVPFYNETGRDDLTLLAA